MDNMNSNIVYGDIKQTQLEWLDNEIDRLERLIKTLPERYQKRFEPTNIKDLPFDALSGLYSMRTALRENLRGDIVAG